MRFTQVESAAAKIRSFVCAHLFGLVCAVVALSFIVGETRVSVALTLATAAVVFAAFTLHPGYPDYLQSAFAWACSGCVLGAVCAGAGAMQVANAFAICGMAALFCALAHNTRQLKRSGARRL